MNRIIILFCQFCPQWHLQKAAKSKKGLLVALASLESYQATEGTPRNGTLQKHRLEGRAGDERKEVQEAQKGSIEEQLLTL
jgi:hypothetical protein